MAPSPPDLRRPRFALPFTILASPGTVRLVAGEDFRYTLNADGLDQWLPGLLSSLDGRRTLAAALSQVAIAHHPALSRIVDRLYGERVLVDGTSAEAHAAASVRLVPEGNGLLLKGLAPSSSAGAALPVLCQDRLDYNEALTFNRRCLESGGPWMWATFGAMARGYVSPVFLPTSGPCLACLIAHFRRRSPAPELYDALETQGKNGGPIDPVPFPGEGVEILRQLMFRKAALLAEPVAPVAAYRLHVLELATFEVSTHRVFRDPEVQE